MRWMALSCVLWLGCGFRAPGGAPGSDADPGGDGPGATDGMPGDGTSTASHTRRIDITDAQVAGGPHADFPLLVSLTADWLRATASGGDVASSSGFDIGFFADAAGATRLAHEVEAYQSSTGELIAWVKVPSLSAATELYLRYGDPSITTSQENAAAVWSADFAAVWHLRDFNDSTSNANLGANAGTTGGGGKIGAARSFDGLDDAVSFGSAASIDDVFVDGGTAEAWFRADSWGEASRGRILEKGDTSTGDTEGWCLSIDNANVAGGILFTHVVTSGDGIGGWNTAAGSVALSQWTHVALVYNQNSTANDPTIYINGAQAAVTEGNPPSGMVGSDAVGIARLGNRGAGDRAFDGLIDEMRLSTVSRSAGWIATSYRNQADPAAFYTVGPPL